jgi:hypothetical protein
MENVSVTSTKRSCGFVRSFVRMFVLLEKIIKRRTHQLQVFVRKGKANCFVVVVRRRRCCDKAQKDSIAVFAVCPDCPKSRTLFRFRFCLPIPYCLFRSHHHRPITKSLVRSREPFVLFRSFAVGIGLHTFPLHLYTYSIRHQAP